MSEKEEKISLRPRLKLVAACNDSRNDDKTDKPGDQKSITVKGYQTSKSKSKGSSNTTDEHKSVSAKMGYSEITSLTVEFSMGSSETKYGSTTTSDTMTENTMIEEIFTMKPCFYTGHYKWYINIGGQKLFLDKGTERFFGKSEKDVKDQVRQVEKTVRNVIVSGKKGKAGNDDFSLFTGCKYFYIQNQWGKSGGKSDGFLGVRDKNMWLNAKTGTKIRWKVVKDENFETNHQIFLYDTTFQKGYVGIDGGKFNLKQLRVTGKKKDVKFELSVAKDAKKKNCFFLAHVGGYKSVGVRGYAQKLKNGIGNKWEKGSVFCDYGEENKSPWLFQPDPKK